MDIQGYLNSTDAAFREAALDLTSDLRERLRAAGFSARAAESVTVLFDGEKFDYDFDGEGAEEAQTLEFGNESKKPLAIIRKFFANEALFEEHVQTNLESKLGGIV